jgi:hypothetical protein
MFSRRLKRIPTDRQILEEIFARHYEDYKKVSTGSDTEASDSKIYFPVDLNSVAKALGTDGNIVFGRLYYYLERKYGFQTAPSTPGKEGAWVHLFWLRFDAPQGRHWMNFPILAAVLASLQEEYRRVQWTRYLAICSLVVSVAAFVLSFRR